jgi:hypothetical protein
VGWVVLQYFIAVPRLYLQVIGFNSHSHLPFSHLTHSFTHPLQNIIEVNPLIYSSHVRHPLLTHSLTHSLALQVIEINAVHHNPARPWLFAVGGSDPYARVYDARRLTSSTTAGRISAASPGTRAAALIARGLPHVSIMEYHGVLRWMLSSVEVH